MHVLLRCLVAATATAWAYDKWRDNAEALTLNDLRNEYSTIFRYGNRNAASHRWATFLLDRAAHLALEALLGELHGCVDKHEAAHEEQVGSPMTSSDLH